MGSKMLKEKICAIAKTAYLRRLTAGSGGNISARRDDGSILITPTKKSLAFLEPEDIVTVDAGGCLIEGNTKPSSELKMHCALYSTLKINAVLHLHPPALNSLAALDVLLELLTFESKLVLGGTPPVVAQHTPIVTDIDSLVAAFQLSNIVVLKNHGTVAVGEDLDEAFALSDVAEEVAQMTIFAHMIKSSESVDQNTPADSRQANAALPVFTHEHMARIQALVNADPEAQKLGQAADLTVRFAIKQAEDGKAFTMHFEKGRITNITADDNADFINAGNKGIWIHIFNSRLDPFAAISQKKLYLEKGQISDLSKWYAPFYRIFALWKEAPVLEAKEE